MPRIMVGSGDTQAVLQLDAIPEVGDNIVVNPEQVVWSRSSAALPLSGNYVIEKDLGSAVFGLHKIPWFDIREVE